MEQKAKFIVIGLIGVLAVVFVLLVGTLNQKQALVKERDALSGENAKLSAAVKSLEKGLNDSRNRVSSLQRDLDSITQEKQDIERKFELANKAKEDLIEKLKSVQPGGALQPQQLQVFPGQTDAYWAGVLKAKTDLELQLSSISNQLRSLQINNEQLQREKSSLELEISNLRREKEDVKRELEYNKKILDSVSQELVRERNDKIQIQDSFKLIKSENTVLSRQLENLNSRKIDLEKRLQDLQVDKENVESRFTEMQSMLTDKISQVNGLKEELDAIRQGAATGTLSAVPQKKSCVELPPIVVRPQQEQAAKGTSAPYQGKVLAINKDSNFVIVDLGEDAGIRVGDSFQVFKGDKSIASVEAIQVRKNITACDIKKQTDSICIGDAVR